MTAKIPGTRKRPQLYVGLQPIPDDAPDRIKSGIAISNSTAVQGICPSCGAEPELTACPELNLMQVVFRHSLDCPVAALLDPPEP